MERNTEPTSEEFLLLACGSAGRWCISVDESAAGDEWTLELDGPSIYLLFSLPDAAIVLRMLDFLRRGPRLPVGRAQDDADNTLRVGQFSGSSSVSLVWDNEDFLRCFLVVGAKSKSTMMINLYAEDIDAIIAALEQVVADLG
jgi:hypothetical protein